MAVTHNYGKVRIVQDNSDIRVEWLKNDQWELYVGFNSLSEDYAFTDVNAAAGRALAILASE